MTTSLKTENVFIELGEEKKEVKDNNQQQLPQQLKIVSKEKKEVPIDEKILKKLSKLEEKMCTDHGKIVEAINDPTGTKYTDKIGPVTELKRYKRTMFCFFLFFTFMFLFLMIIIGILVFVVGHYIFNIDPLICIIYIVIFDISLIFFMSGNIIIFLLFKWICYDLPKRKYNRLGD